MQPVKIVKPCTVYIKFTENVPSTFVLKNDKDEIYYFRYLPNRTPRIKFNIVHPGEYIGNADFEVVKMTDIEIPSYIPKLPPAERNRVKDFTVKVNPELSGVTPIIFSEIGLIQVPPDFYTLPPCVRYFLLLHEAGHAFYEDEEKCDLFALVNYLREGYNRSMAFYSLNNVLKRSNQNTRRLFVMLENIQSTQNEPLL